MLANTTAVAAAALIDSTAAAGVRRIHGSFLVLWLFSWLIQTHVGDPPQNAGLKRFGGLYGGFLVVIWGILIIIWGIPQDPINSYKVSRKSPQRPKQCVNTQTLAFPLYPRTTTT
jgi:hypothetical protein